jgi:hypothetical protein
VGFTFFGLCLILALHLQNEIMRANGSCSP